MSTYQRAAGLVILGVALGCASVPGSTPAYRVASTEPRGPYLETLLEWTSSLAAVSSDAKITLLFPADDNCRATLVPEATVEYLPTGMTGSVRHGDRTCASVGIANLREWRDRRPRTARGMPRAQATYEVVGDANGYTILRGRFPLANMVGWSGGEDTLALVPKNEACALVLERTVASIEYKTGGRNVLFLVSSAGPCQIHGLVRP